MSSAKTKFERFDIWLEKQSDRLNPVLVKETRQAMKSRHFLLAFLLMLLLSWGFLAFVFMAYGEQLQWNNAGPAIFRFLYFFLNFCLFMFVPYSVFANMRSEFDRGTHEMLVITTLSPHRIVHGKIFSGMVQMGTYIFSISPFLCMAFLLGGISIVAVIFYLFISIVLSLIICLAGLMMGSLSKMSMWSVVNLLVLFGGGLLVLTILTSVTTQAGLGAAAYIAMCVSLSFLGVLLLFVAGVSIGVSTAQLSPIIMPYETSPAFTSRRPVAMRAPVSVDQTEE